MLNNNVVPIASRMPEPSAADSIPPVILHLRHSNDIPQVWGALQGLLRELSRPGFSATVSINVGSRQVGQCLVRCDKTDLLQRLTPAERELIHRVCEGMSNVEIAHALDKSVKTVKGQFTSIYRKLGVRSRGRLLALLR